MRTNSEHGQPSGGKQGIGHGGSETRRTPREHTGTELTGTAGQSGHAWTGGGSPNSMTEECEGPRGGASAPKTEQLGCSSKMRPHKKRKKGLGPTWRNQI